MDLRLPQLGDIMTEGRLTAWLQEDGAAVAAGQPLYDLETDKVSFTVEAPAAGVLRQVVPAGETVPVGAVVAQLLEEVRATPAARALARQLGVDLATISVPGGRIREADVRTAATASSADSLPYAGRRRAIGERMLRSRQTTAALTLTSEVRVDAALDLIDELNSAWRDDPPHEIRTPPPRFRGDPGEGVVVTLTRLIVRACALALLDHPLLNARLRDDRIELPGTVDVGLAMDQEAGLVVPVLRGADRLSLRDTAVAARDLTRRAEAGGLTQAEAAGATFTVTSLAGTVVDGFTPILDPPQAAILGIGRVREIAGFEPDRVVRHRVTTLSLTFDHRVADGAPAARFLGRVAELLGNPAELR